MKLIPLSVPFSLVLLTACSPLVHKLGESDLNSGYVKSIEYKVKNRYSKKVVHEGYFTKEDGKNYSIDIQSVGSEKIRLAAYGTDRIKPGMPIKYTLITHYKWPIFGINRTKSFSGELVVGDFAELHGSHSAICLELGENHSNNISLAPPTKFDSLALKTSATGSQLDFSTHKNIDSTSLYTVNAIGKELGATTMTISVGRDQIKAIQIIYTTVPSSSPPIGLRARPIQAGDNNTPPADVDYETSKPIVLVWDKKFGAKRFTVQVFNPDGSRILGALLGGSKQSYVAWLPQGSYSWRIRAEVATCTEDNKWTQFSERQSINVE